MHRPTPQLDVPVSSAQYQRTFQKRLNVHCNFPISDSFKKFVNWLAISRFRSAGMWSCLAGLTLADVSKEEALILLDRSSLTNSGVTFPRNIQKNKTATQKLHRQTDRQTAVELEQRDTGNGEDSCYRRRFNERNRAEEYFDKKRNKQSKRSGNAIR